MSKLLKHRYVPPKNEYITQTEVWAKAAIRGTYEERNSHQTESNVVWRNPTSGRSLVLGKECYSTGDMIIKNAVKTIPHDAMYVPYSESKRDLAIRLSRTNLDNSHFHNFGRYGRIITRLNELPHPQPKRITYSAVVDEAKCEGKYGGNLFKLMLYDRSGNRPLEDSRCRPMPREVYLLGKYLWESNAKYLTELSRTVPPNSCQINLYYSAYGGAQKPHSDNSRRKRRSTYQRRKKSHHRIQNNTRLCGDVQNFENPLAKIRNSAQIHGTNVMSFSAGSSMKLSMYQYNKNTDKFETNKVLGVILEHGTCFILDPRDDETMLHGAKFLCKSGGMVRASFNFRWCRMAHWFYGDQHVHRSLRNAVASHIEIKSKDVKWKFLLEGKERNYDYDKWKHEVEKKGYSGHLYFDDNGCLDTRM